MGDHCINRNQVMATHFCIYCLNNDRGIKTGNDFLLVLIIYLLTGYWDIFNV